MTNYDLRSRLTLGYCLSQPDKALEEGILEPLRSVQGTDGVGSSPCVVIIDGIGCGNSDSDDNDSSSSSSNSSISSFLSRHLDEFPNWIKFLVTVRSDKKGLRAIKGLPFHQIR